MGEILIYFRKITVKGLKNVRNKLTLEKLRKIYIIMDNIQKKWYNKAKILKIFRDI